MKRKDLIHLVGQSIIGGALDAKRIEKVAGLLKKSELRQFIHQLRLYQAARRITVTMALADDSIEKSLQQIFKHKDVVVTEDQKLGAGIKVLDGDMLIDMTVAHRLDTIVHAIEENYN